MPPKFFPLRWETTADQWWFASPVECAAASGHYDLVRELLRLDADLIIDLASLPRLRRLETLWDDDFNDVAKCRTHVARQLLHECETSDGRNTLIGAGYGGWVLYTAAAAGDLVLVKELLDRDGFIVFGEGEYGVTDMFYAAARSGNAEVFRLLFDCAVGRRGEVFRWEVMNRAVHAAAKGGGAAVLGELLREGMDVLGFRDATGATVLHSAAARGQVQIVKKLISSYGDTIDSTDDQGNTAMNVAAYYGHLAVMDVLITASPSSAKLTNNYGNTFLHMAIAGFRTPSFRPLEQQIELMKEVVDGKLLKIEEIINVGNNDGRTALHIAIAESIQFEVVELLLSVQCIDVNIRDGGGNTPLDLLKHMPRTASSEVLVKRLVMAGGMSSSEDRTVRNVGSRMRWIGGSPGTSFRIPDTEMVLYTGVDYSCHSSRELVDSEYGYSSKSSSPKLRKSSSMTRANHGLKILFSWPRRGVAPKSRSIPLRQQFSRQAFPPNNQRSPSFKGNLSSPTLMRKFVGGLTPNASPCNTSSKSSWSSPASVDPTKPASYECISTGPSSSIQSPNVEKIKMKRRSGSFNLGLINNYFCSGTHHLAIENSIRKDLRKHHR